MIIKGNRRKRRHSGWVGALILLGLLVVLILYKTQDNQKEKPVKIVDIAVITCGAENISGEYFIENGHKFSGINTQSEVRVRSGNYSSMVNKKDQRGLSYVIEQPIPGKTYKAEVWRIGKEVQTGTLAVSGENPDVFYKETSQEVYNDGSWWQKLELIFTIPFNINTGKITVFVYKKEGDLWIFFDDFAISEIEYIDIENKGFTPPTLNLYIDNEGLEVPAR